MGVEAEALAECCANRCFAEEVRAALAGAGVELRVRHRSIFGRDRILAAAHRQARQSRKHVVLFIDYEVGPLRAYVTELFPGLQPLGRAPGVLVGRSGRAGNLVAVVFDPNIEEALKVRDEALRRELKRCRGCGRFKRLIGEEVVRETAERLLGLLGS